VTPLKLSNCSFNRHQNTLFDTKILYLIQVHKFAHLQHFPDKLRLVLSPNGKVDSFH